MKYVRKERREELRDVLLLEMSMVNVEKDDINLPPPSKQ